jgi:uncharacterized protein (TIGR03790 family)
MNGNWSRRRTWMGLSASVCMMAAQAQAFAQVPLSERVLVVYNAKASDALSVAKYYMEQRGIPTANRCRISVSSPDIIRDQEFESRVKIPLRKCLETAGKQRILYIVLAYGTPYVVTIGERGFALDQFVADIWDEYSSPTRNGMEAGAHPYFADASSKAKVYAPFLSLAAYRDQPLALNIYSVWRLDATTPALAKGLVDKAVFAEKYGLAGRGCFDRQYGTIKGVGDSGSGAGDWDIHRSAELARAAGFEVTEDDHGAEFGTSPAPLRCTAAALYAGWYSLNHYNDVFTWNPGAIGFHLDSASAANPRGGTNWAANAILKGITLTSGAVTEPYLEGLAHPDQAFLELFRGANAGDALLRSTRWLKWMIINIGDPLYRPFGQATTRVRDQ